MGSRGFHLSHHPLFSDTLPVWTSRWRKWWTFGRSLRMLQVVLKDFAHATPLLFLPPFPTFPTSVPGRPKVLPSREWVSKFNKWGVGTETCVLNTGMSHHSPSLFFCLFLDLPYIHSRAVYHWKQGKGETCLEPWRLVWKWAVSERVGTECDWDLRGSQ